MLMEKKVYAEKQAREITADPSINLRSSTEELKARVG